MDVLASLESKAYKVTFQIHAEYFGAVCTGFSMNDELAKQQRKRFTGSTKAD